MAGGKLISTGVEFPDATTQTTSGLPLTGGTMTGDVSLGDNVKAKFGAGDDLKLYHDGTDSRIENETGILFIHQLQASGNTIFYNHNSADVVKNCLQLGGATPNVQLYHNGVQVASTQSGGIAFGTDTAAANTLDDYEVGTFTLLHEDGTAMNNVGATYTKIGDLVQYSLDVVALKDTISIKGLPYTSNSTDNTAFHVGYQTTSTNLNYGHMSPSTSKISNWYSYTNGVATILNGERVIISGAYRTT